MRIVKAKDIGEREVERMLTKAAFDEVELNPKIREGNKKLFGRDMSAAELVRMIVNDVRKDGDKAVMHYTKLIDKVDLTPENMLVSEEEFAAAEAAADEAVVALVKLVVVVEERAQGNHALAAVLRDFNVEAKLRHAADRSVEFLSQTVGHKLHLLVLDAGALGLRGQLLHG